MPCPKFLASLSTYHLHIDAPQQLTISCPNRIHPSLPRTGSPVHSGPHSPNLKVHPPWSPFPLCLFLSILQHPLLSVSPDPLHPSSASSTAMSPWLPWWWNGPHPHLFQSLLPDWSSLGAHFTPALGLRSMPPPGSAPTVCGVLLQSERGLPSYIRNSQLYPSNRKPSGHRLAYGCSSLVLIGRNRIKVVAGLRGGMPTLRGSSSSLG